MDARCRKYGSLSGFPLRASASTMIQQSLLGTNRYDLAPCEIGKAWIIDSCQHGLAFFSAVSMGHMSGCPPALISAESFRSNPQASSHQRSCRQDEQPCNGLGRGAMTEAYLQKLNHCGSLFSRDQVSSSRSKILLNSFEIINSVPATVSAFSFLSSSSCRRRIPRA